jgi:hypothetical protein
MANAQGKLLLKKKMKTDHNELSGISQGRPIIYMHTITFSIFLYKRSNIFPIIHLTQIKCCLMSLLLWNVILSLITKGIIIILGSKISIQV